MTSKTEHMQKQKSFYRLSINRLSINRLSIVSTSKSKWRFQIVNFTKNKILMISFVSWLFFWKFAIWIFIVIKVQSMLYVTYIWKKNDKSITLIFRREIHLINNFKINMLINNDVIESKKIIINSIKKQTFIINIDVIISIKVKSSKNNIQRSIHIRKTIIVLFHIEMMMFINDINLFESKSFLFESIDDVNFTLYVHLIDAFIFVVVVRNDYNQSIQISRNFRLNRIFKLNYFNAFQINSKQIEKIKSLTIRKSKSTHKNDWFKKLLIVCVTTYAIVTTVSINNVFIVNNSNIELFTATLSTSSIVNTIISIIFIDSIFSTSKFSKLMLFNNVIIHLSNVANFFVKIVEKFSVI